MPYFATSQATIASGQTVGAVVNLRGQRLVGIKTPAALTGVTLTWQVCESDSGTFNPAFHLNTLAATATVITSVAAAQYIALPYDKAPINCFLKLVSGSAEAADRTFVLFTEPV